jgi:hypothetical protein
MKITKMQTALIVEVIGAIATAITGHYLIIAHPVKTVLVIAGVATLVVGEMMRRYNSK